MRYAGIDIAAETHVVAIVDVDGKVVQKATKFTEDAQGYAELLATLGPTTNLQVGMEATGHYWQNVFGFLTAHDVAVTVINPLRTRRHAEEDLARAKTDAIDAVGIARYLQEKRPAPTRLAEATTLQLRELVRLRDRLVQDMVEKVQQLHRVIDLGFPEFTRFVNDLGSGLATSLLERYGTARGFAASRVGDIANLIYDGRRAVGRRLAGELVEAAKASVGRHHGHVYELQATYACQDIRTLRDRLKSLDAEIATTVDKNELGTLLKTIDGIGTNTSARIIADVGRQAHGASVRRFRQGHGATFSPGSWGQGRG